MCKKNPFFKILVFVSSLYSNPDMKTGKPLVKVPIYARITLKRIFVAFSD